MLNFAGRGDFIERRTQAVTVRIAGAEAEIHNGADAATVEAVLRAVKSC